MLEGLVSLCAGTSCTGQVQNTNEFIFKVLLFCGVSTYILRLGGGAYGPFLGRAELSSSSTPYDVNDMREQDPHHPLPPKAQLPHPYTMWIMSEERGSSWSTCSWKKLAEVSIWWRMDGWKIATPKGMLTVDKPFIHYILSKSTLVEKSF